MSLKDKSTKINKSIDINKFSVKTIDNIAKIIGIKLPYRKSNVQTLEEYFKFYNKEQELYDILNFLVISQRPNIHEFMYKLKNKIGKGLQKQKKYKEVNQEKIEEEIELLNKQLIYNHMKSYQSIDNEGKYYLSLDIRSANFTVLKQVMGGLIHENSWSEYFKRRFPKDVRSDSRKNQELGIVGQSYDVPQCLYESKYLRQFIIGDLTKLKFLWELENLKLLQKVCDIGINNLICVNSDELIIEVKDYDEADKIINELNPINDMFRIKKFRLQKINDYKNQNYLLKEFDDGSRALFGVGPDHHMKLYQIYILCNH